jgi:hypothetical protein
MSATATINGKPRKQLSDQLDRLDRIIDALGDALPEAVSDAAREGTRTAVKEAILEILANPDLRNVVLAATPVEPARIEPTPKPTLWARVKARVAAAKDALVGRCRAATAAVREKVRTLTAALPVRQILTIGAVVGIVVGFFSYACPHTLSAVISGLAGACTAVAALVGRWLRRSVESFGFGTT